MISRLTSLVLLAALVIPGAAQSPKPIPPGTVPPVTVAAANPLITLPAEVRGEAGDFLMVTAETKGEEVRWFTCDPGLRVFPPQLLKNSKTAVVIGRAPGTYRLYAYTCVDGALSDPAVCVVQIGEPGPQPPVPPVPVPPVPVPPVPVPPVPVPPPPAGEFRVIFVYESSSALTAGQRASIFGPRVADYLDRKTAPTDGGTGWRRWDPHVNVQEGPTWKAMWAAAKPQLTGPLPSVVIFSGDKGQVYALPATPEATLALLETVGGK